MKDWYCKDVWCRQGLPLGGVLRQWCDLVDLTAKRWWKAARDVPWWYNERANLSQFAGAVSRVGGIVFEEFSTKKREIGTTTGRFKGEYQGRVDLYFETTAGGEFNAEAKGIWSGAKSPGSNPRSRVETTLKQACRDIKQFAPYGTRRLGMVFVRPYIMHPSGVDTSERIEAWLNKMWEIECDAIAWVFPKRCTLGLSDGSVSPGVVLLIKEVHR